MKNTFALCLVFALSSLTLVGQSKTIEDRDQTTVIKRLMLSPGINYNTFQNTNFSTTNWSGVGGVIEFCFDKTTNNYSWELGLELPYIATSASSHEGTGNIFNPSLHLGYLRHLSDKLSLGGRWDIMDYYLHNQNELGNNSNYNLQSSTLFVSAGYHTCLRGKKNVWAGLHLGLLSFNRESTGFAFSSPQNVLEEGRFNYQDEAINDPFGFKYYELDFLNSYLQLRTIIGMQLTKQSSLSYAWQMRHFSEIKGYPTTTGQHLIKFNFTLVATQRIPKKQS